jgi:uncharacterized protein (DUF302 family)
METEKNEQQEICLLSKTGLFSPCTAGGRQRLILGYFLGIITSFLLVWFLMPGMMIHEYESRFDTVEETCSELKASIESAGWTCLAIRNVNASMKKEEGVDFAPKIRIVELRNANYFKEVLASRPDLSTLMPCAFGVYEAPDGKIRISELNFALIGKMFGGSAAKSLGKHIAGDERKILSCCIK